MLPCFLFDVSGSPDNPGGLFIPPMTTAHEYAGINLINSLSEIHPYIRLQSTPSGRRAESQESYVRENAVTHRDRVRAHPFAVVSGFVEFT